MLSTLCVSKIFSSINNCPMYNEQIYSTFPVETAVHNHGGTVPVAKADSVKLQEQLYAAKGTISTQSNELRKIIK